MSKRRLRARKTGEGTDLLRRARGEARLQAATGQEVPKSNSDNLPVQELVKPNGVQRPQNASAQHDPGVGEQGKRHVPAPIPLGRRRGGNSV